MIGGTQRNKKLSPPTFTAGITMGNSDHLEGNCHCGNIHYQLQLTKSLKTYIGRACQCSFCQKHSATYISDPQGKLSIHIKNGDQVSRYQFASKVAEFLVCQACGVLPCAIRKIDEKLYAVVNIHSLKSDIVPGLTTQPFDYDGESESDKEARHTQNWISEVKLTVDT